MNWDEAIKLLDELHVENEPPPRRVIELAREKMRAMETLNYSAPSSVECGPNGDVLVAWKLPRLDVRLAFWNDGEVEVSAMLDGSCVLSRLPLME